MDSELSVEKAKTKVRQREADGEQQRVHKGASSLEEMTERAWNHSTSARKQKKNFA